MKKGILKYTTTILALSSIFASSASALGLAYSDKTKKPSPLFKIETGVSLPFNLSINGKLNFSPSYSDLIGNFSDSQPERLSFIGDAEVNLAYNFNLLDSRSAIGDFNPTIAPFVGYKHYLSYTALGGGELTSLLPQSYTSNIGGINYGLRFFSKIPLGFFINGKVGATSLLNGSWSQNDSANKGDIMSNGQTLPFAGVGASWHILNLLTLYAGYDLLYIPEIRATQGTLSLNDNSKNLVHSLNAGLSFLFFSI